MLYFITRSRKHTYALSSAEHDQRNQLIIFFSVAERENNGSQDLEMHDRDFWISDEEGKFRFTSTPPDGQFPLQNISHIKFEPPKVPVVFVLGKLFDSLKYL